MVVALGWLARIVATGSLGEVVIGATIVGAGTGIGFAAMPTLISEHTPEAGLAAANGLNSLARTLGGAVASAIGGSLLTASTIRLGTLVVLAGGVPGALRALLRGGRAGRRGGAARADRARSLGVLSREVGYAGGWWVAGECGVARW